MTPSASMKPEWSEMNRRLQIEPDLQRSTGMLSRRDTLPVILSQQSLGPTERGKERRKEQNCSDEGTEWVQVTSDDNHQSGGFGKQ